MASPVTDLEAGLQAMQNLKPPGVSGSRITSLTTLCVSNIQACQLIRGRALSRPRSFTGSPVVSESVLIQKIYTHFKKTPGTHKLGVLYVVDSVTRKWLEQAKSQGQAVNSSAPDGTYAAGVHRVTELMPVLMNDILQTCPEEQKEKIKKLLDIWEKGQTFPAPMVESFREKLNTAPQKTSTTPPGTPPPGLAASLQVSAPAPAAAPAPAPAAAPPAQSSQSILDALANLARQNTSASTTPTPAAPGAAAPPTAPAAPAYGVPPPAVGLPQPVSSSISQPPQYPPAAPAAAPSALPFSLPQLLGQQATSTPPIPAAGPTYPPNPQFPGAPAAGAPGGLALDPQQQQQLLLVKALADQGIPFDKIPALLQGLGAAGAVPGQQAPPTGPAATGAYPAWGGAQGAAEPPRDWRAGPNGPGGPNSPGRYGNRSRSRSPDRGWNGRGSPRGGSGRLDYGGARSPPRGNGRRPGPEYRNRSPPRRRGQSPPPAEKWIDNDPNLPSGSIKVLSRTLFVGGVTCSEPELRNIFTRYGTVQTCIVNKDKRHAFVKMLTRRDAEFAKDGTEDSRNLEIPLRTRWGVGFGPRDCSDYATGVSVIPIHRLTDADRKWMLTAPNGGSGGRPIVTGMVVEEPDIEIGAGVSSKAISRRMQTDKGGAHGPKSTRNRGNHRDHDDPRDRGDDRGGAAYERGRDGGGGGAGGAPAFPFGMGSLPNGMPSFPSGGFQYQDQNGGQGGRWA